MVCGRGFDRFKNVVLGGPPGALRCTCFEILPWFLCFLLNVSLALFIVCCFCIGKEGFSISRGLVLHTRWESFLRPGSSGPLTWDDFDAGAHLGIDGFAQRVAGSLDKLARFIRGVVVHRRDTAIRGWRNWVLEGPPCASVQEASS